MELSSGPIQQGIDLVDVDRFREVFGDESARLRRVFTRGELRDAERGSDPMASLAARFAAKEAALKALGIGIGAIGIDRRLKEIEVRKRGAAPVLALRGGLAKRARRAGIRHGSVSLTHDGGLAMASVLLHAVGGSS